jgi:hypothetical protein
MVSPTTIVAAADEGVADDPVQPAQRLARGRCF